MEVLYFLVPLAVLLALGAVAAFRWAARDEQFDDLVSPAVRILQDDLATPRPAAVDGNASAASDLPRPGGAK